MQTTSYCTKFEKKSSDESIEIEFSSPKRNQYKMDVDLYKKSFNVNVEIARFYNVYGPGQINTGDMATVIGIFENQYLNKKPLTVVKPGSQTRRFTHIKDTVEVCYRAFKDNKCKYYSVSNKNSYSILDVAKMFKSKILFLKPRLGERYASALKNNSYNNKIIQKFGRLQLKDYISSFIKSH